MNLLKHKIILSSTLLVLLLVTFFFRQETYFLQLLSLIIIIFLFLTIYGSFQIKWNYFVDSINKGNNNAICFTFDDGPDPELTPKILEILETENLKAAFFVIGSKVEIVSTHCKGTCMTRAYDCQSHIYSNKIALFSPVNRRTILSNVRSQLKKQ